MAKKIREFKDGTYLVETAPSCWEVLDKKDFAIAQLSKVDLGVEIMNRLETLAPHCEFKIVRNDEEDHIYLDDEPLINLMTYYGSLKVYQNHFCSGMCKECDTMTLDEFIDTKLMPSVELTFSQAEQQKCISNWKYFHDNYFTKQ